MGTVGAKIGDYDVGDIPASAHELCTGSTTPSGTSVPFYEIQCGDHVFSLLNPYGKADKEFEVGAAIKCTIDPTGNDPRTVYRFMEDGTLRGYPSPAIADSWDDDWRTTIIRIQDCTDNEFGPIMKSFSEECTASDCPDVCTGAEMQEWRLLGFFDDSCIISGFTYDEDFFIDKLPAGGDITLFGST